MRRIRQHKRDYILKKERKHIRNHQRCIWTAEKHIETVNREKQQTVLSSIPRSLGGTGEAEDTTTR
jgi:hypothetical protein